MISISSSFTYTLDDRAPFKFIFVPVVVVPSMVEVFLAAHISPLLSFNLLTTLAGLDDQTVNVNESSIMNFNILSLF
jgi:hypothetical protein